MLKRIFKYFFRVTFLKEARLRKAGRIIFPKPKTDYHCSKQGFAIINSRVL